MKGILRKTRKKLISDKKVTQYILYAIGEILLVIIGILLALKIDNNNTRRIEGQRFRSDLEYTLEDIEKDKEFVLKMNETRLDYIQRNNFLLGTIEEKQKLRAIDILVNLKILDIDYFKRNENGFQRLMSSNFYEADEFKEAREKIRIYNGILARYIERENKLNSFIEELEMEMYKDGTLSKFLEFRYLFDNNKKEYTVNGKTELVEFMIDSDKFITNNPVLLTILRRSNLMIKNLTFFTNEVVRTGEDARIEIEKYLQNPKGNI